MHDKIRSYHLERIAFVYLRQSSPTQVKKHREGRQRQQRMQEHVQKLGWPASQIRLLGSDTGRTASTLHGREDYQTILEAVMERTAGLVAARDLSRLARDNQDWNQLIRLCRFQDVLLCDEYRVYEAADPQDRVLLGIQGAFNEFELAMITDRMQECRRQKAQRGQLYEGFPPGYICRREPLQEKHPDERVQRAVEKVFADFDRQPSVYALYRQLLAEGFQLPVVRNGRDWRELDWVTPSYDQLLAMLRNPTYAGIYVRGRRKVVRELDAQGHAVKRERRVPRERWEVFLEDHHEPYISSARWEENLKKIAANTRSRGDVHPGAPGQGASLLARLLRCRRCGHRLHVSYAQGLRYTCRSGALQRKAHAKGCFSFAARRVERRVSELVLYAVQPAGVEAARLAAEQMAAAHQGRRQVWVDRVEACREAEARAAREYKATDETYVAVRRKLAAEWDECLQTLHIAERRLAEFDAQREAAPTAAECAQLESLGADLERVWFDADTDPVLKKQIVRLLIEEIMVDVDPARDEIVLGIHWSGGHHSEHRLPRQGRRRRLGVRDLKEVVETLRKVLSDESIAAVLNREGIPSLRGESWTRARVTGFRRQHNIAAYNAREKERQGWLTQAEAATRLEISPISVSRLVQAGVIPAEQPRDGLPSVIREPDLHLPEVQRAVYHLKASKNRPLPADPNQLSLFPTTNLQ